MLIAMEKFQPTEVGRGGFNKMLRLAGAVGLAGGFIIFYQRSIRTLPSGSSYMLAPRRPDSTD